MIVLFFLLLIGGACFVNAFAKTSFGLSLPIFTLCSVVLLYICGMVNALVGGVYVLAAITIAGFIFASVRLIHRQMSFRNLFSSSGIIAFAILFFVLWLFDFNKFYIEWDNFSHWGIMAKEMVRLDAFYNVAGASPSAHMDYPPALTLFEYLGCKITGGFSEPVTMLSLQVFTLSFMMSVFDHINIRKQIPKFISLLIIVITVPMILAINEVSYYTSIYVDATLGVLFGFGVFTALMHAPGDGRRSYIYQLLLMVLISFVLVSIKQSAVFFLGGIWLCFLVYQIGVCKSKYDRSGFCFQRKHLLPVITLAASLLAAVIAKVSWSAHLLNVGVTGGQFQPSSMGLSQLSDLLPGNISESQALVIKSFVNAFFNVSLVNRPPIIALPYFLLLVLLIAVLACLYLHYKETESRLVVSSLLIALPVLAIAYAFFMLCCYVFLFGGDEALRLASFERYLSTYFVGAIIAIIMVVATVPKPISGSSKSEKHGSYVWIAIAVVFLSIVPPPQYTNMLYPFSIAETQYWTKELYGNTKEWSRELDESTDKVWYISEWSNGYDYFITRYATAPLQMNGYSTWSIGTPQDEKDFYTRADIDKEKWAEMLIDGN
ncbi:MAG: hypothetical protein LBN36_06730, partial [Clostridiales Family XIII bacterium]|nr:hypothetical protein [Clostridiales Family XIII bacterium]